MKALSELLQDRGWRLSGSDAAAPAPDSRPVARVTSSSDTLADRRILRIHNGHSADHVPASADVVIHSPAISEANPERESARNRGVPEVSYVEMIGELMQDQTGICIAGTHGKTTTTALVATIMREAGLDPSAVVGGEVIQYERSGWSGRGDCFVAEACEYRRHFLKFRPHIAAILNIESDHFDCFDSYRDVCNAFREFAATVPPKGVIVVNADNAAALESIKDCRCRVETFSVLNEAHWTINDVEPIGLQSRFRIAYRGRDFGSFTLPLPGEHNVENALAAIAMCHAAGVSANTIGTVLPRFRGVRRRFEILGSARGTTLIDDYAHHPTAVQATLAAARQSFGHRRLVAAFQPHQVLRTQRLMKEFAASFRPADQVYLVPIFAAREESENGDTTLRELGDRIAQKGVDVEVLTSLDQLQTTVEDSARPEDVWITMGAGDIYRVAHESVRTLQ
jgi:UDP-N-acetylmuramate--alanine ligase